LEAANPEKRVEKMRNAKMVNVLQTFAQRWARQIADSILA
jgi:hypothetical protein